MPLSLGSGRGGYGFGVRSLRPALIAGRTKSYASDRIITPDVPNGSFDLSYSGTSIGVYGADGNLSGSATAASIIDGTGQRFVGSATTYSNGYLWTFAKNAANELRLVRADFSGSIVTPGAKFSTANGTIHNDLCFVYESGSNLIVRAYASASQFELVISKITGQLLSETKTIDSIAGLAAGVYVTEDGMATVENVGKNSTTDLHVNVRISSFNGGLAVTLGLPFSEFIGCQIDSTGTWRPILIGELVYLMSISSYQLPLRYFKRTEFDRYILDLCKKIDFLG
jgi:hypothetical protein